MYKNIMALIVAGVLLGGCKKVLSPLDDNHRTLQSIYNDPYFAEGILMNAYTRLPTNGYSFNDVATDDAVTNDKSSSLLYMATGAWSAANNPVEQWTNSFTAINYINLFLKQIDSVNWSPMSKNVRTLFADRLKGEAYGLRALFLLHLLQAHAGPGTNGQLLGVPILTQSLELNSDFSTQRSTFDQCMTQIYNDLTEAEKYLPLDYADASAVPSKYSGMTLAEYNRVFGFFNRERISTRIVKAIRAKAALLAASPAFNLQGNSTKWEDAANYAGDLLDRINGVNGLDPQGGLFYTQANADKIDLTKTPAIDQSEMLWRGNIGTSRNLEVNNFPPTLFGNGRVNPTQNLVDAFPMKNGYPTTDPASAYDAANPYANRDPRLRNYILVNGGNIGSKTIWTKSDNPTNDAVNATITSTRTGYYLRKLLREDVNANPSSFADKKHYPVHIRYTEIFLIYAEAANEAWGPDGKGIHTNSAREVIAAIRKRAGIIQPDAYLASITTKEDMRKLIHNERRLELCFEGFRFWDLRRWKEPLTEQAKGVTINNNVFTVQPIEKRQYSDYMYYGPVPQIEALKANLQQNKGW